MAIDIERVKNSVNIIDIIDSAIGLKKTGKDYQACCPFHTEKSPSFTVSEPKQFYHCFGCGAHGSVIDFIMDYNGVDFKEAVKMIDSNAFDDMNQSAQFVKKVRIPVPLEQERHTDLEETLNGCEYYDGVYFLQGHQVLPLTDLNRKLISLAMLQGKGFDIKFYKKQFTYGSCYMFGDMMNGVILTCDYWQALKVHAQGLAVICVFDPLNIHFIVKDIRRFGFEPALICNTREDFIQAEKMQMYEVYNKNVGDIVVTDQYLDNGEI